MEAYLQPENPVTRDPLEEKATKHLHRHDHPDASYEGPSQQHNTRLGDAIPSSLGRGVRGSGPVDAQEARETGRGGYGDGQLQQNENVNADEQMATLSEGKVAHAVQRKSGTQQVPGSGPAEEQDFASDLDRHVKTPGSLLFFFFSASLIYLVVSFPESHLPGTAWHTKEKRHQRSLTRQINSYRKKAEQAAAREEIKESRRSGVDVDGGAVGRLGDETLYNA